MSNLIRSELERFKRNAQIARSKHINLKPFYVASHFNETEINSIRARFGNHIKLNQQNRKLNVELLVGSSEEYGYSTCAAVASASQDNFGGLQISLWKLLTEEFHKAVKDFYSLRGKLVRKVTGDFHPNFAPAEPIKFKQSETSNPIDLDYWGRVLAQTSKKFYEYDNLRRIVDVDIALNEEFLTDCIVNTDGTEIITRRAVYNLVLEGKIISPQKRKKNYLIPFGIEKFFTDPSQLPSEQDLDEMVRFIVNRLHQLYQAPKQHPIEVPTILMPDIASRLLYLCLEKYFDEDNWMTDYGLHSGPEKGDRLGSKILSVSSQAQRKTFAGQPLLGHTKFDTQGVKPQKIHLIRNGKFGSYLQSRLVMRDGSVSSGHANHTPGNLFIESSSQVSQEELEKRLIQICRERGLDYGLIASGVMLTDDQTSCDEMVITATPQTTWRVYANKVKCPDCKNIHLPDDKELVRGVDINISPKILLGDIILAGGKSEVSHLYHRKFGFGTYTSLVSPAVLVSNLEIKTAYQTESFEPVYPHPLDKASEGS